ncbi:exported hypothetical protein [Bradyrhizobium sp. ORS 375]|uniref:hypothetical protein n=1 Tax=Bradyrhizobium sp. (strain ORS 375) TaxID=566679 RepID=UPI0002409092|nr:hypothetical protein [Bradyrhizobium sp. ORS 375]CCD91581.1 exported hypothetical protein [Bradyrhizobium sp. ORS 375]
MQTRTIAIIAAALLTGASAAAMAQSSEGQTPTYGNRPYGRNYQGQYDQESAQGMIGSGPSYDAGNRVRQQLGSNQNDGDRWPNQPYGAGQGRMRNASNQNEGQQGQGGQNRMIGANATGQSQLAQWENVPRDVQLQLQQEGYSNVRVAPGSMVVSAEDPNGRDVLLLVGPRPVTKLTAADNGNSGWKPQSSTHNQADSQASHNGVSSNSSTVGQSRDHGSKSTNAMSEQDDGASNGGEASNSAEAADAGWQHSPATPQ